MTKPIKERITTVLLEDGEGFTLPQGYLLMETTRISIKDCTLPGEPKEAYGNLGGLYRLWKETKADWVCFNDGEHIPALTEELLEQLDKGESGMVVPRVYTAAHLQENYRSHYYGYDFRMLLALLKHLVPAYYEFGKKEVFEGQEYYMLSGIMPKRLFDSFCAWMFPLLEKCAACLPLKRSAFQSRYLEHLAPYLFTLYTAFHKKKWKPVYVSPVSLLRNEEQGKEEGALPDVLTDSKEKILSQITRWMELREVEKAVWFASMIPEGRTELTDVKALFERYEKERRYYRETALDVCGRNGQGTETDWKSLLKQQEKQTAPFIRRGAPKLLFFRWASVGRDLNEEAFRRFGFECHTFEAPHRMFSFDEDCLEQINCHLDRNRFDFVFSMNCFGMLAEACHIHDIPYVAWSYDAPSFSGDRWYLRYPTTHVFLFDSDDAENYRNAGLEQAHYLPLASNLEHFDGIVCTPEDRGKYGAEISFIGSLYDSALPKAMGYLTDYQKGYLGALIDSQLDVYGHSFFPEILSENLMKWLDQPQFNYLINKEWDGEGARKDMTSAGRLELLMCKQTTNKERLLLLNLLGKHHEVKLWSYKDNEALKHLTYCGTADYNTEMPKIFRLSRINLNATLRSIRNGIPLRCLDIMACGGLLLTNYQKDFDDHFRDGENVLFYTDAGEALEKADFYLAHEDIRAKIARAGYETVKKYYSYPVKIKEMLKLAGLEELLPKERR